jgi:hypothetical protein
MVGAAIASARFVGRHPRGTIGLYLLNALIFALILAGYAAFAPGAGWAGAGVWVAFVGTEVYLIARVWAKLVFAASQVTFFQSRLAHAGFAAFPLTARPEPPVVEALGAPAEASSGPE